MRTTEERVEAVRRRTAQIEQQKRHRRNRIVTLSSAAFCLALITGISFSMPELSEELTAADFAGYETAAGIFGGSAAAGYFVIGLFAFALGVCVTILCFRLRAFQKDQEKSEETEGNAVDKTYGITEDDDAGIH